MIIGVLRSIKKSEERTFSGKEPLAVTRLSQASNLNQTTFNFMAKILIKQKLVEAIPRTKTKSTYHLSIEGRDWLKQFDALMDILEIPSVGMPS